ncbi:Glutaredoxin domain [Cordyceps militaris]|uniref:Glutaredoxin domain n=1 Tax=Cordyceps militaris TaxID=73501 RepID=A0A2H4SFS3_CORMI|nr:Glutaredoxin domain [Cordyceps militaris]
MPSARRLRLVTLAAVVTVVFVLLYASGFGGGSGQSADFYHKTMDAMHGRSPAGQSVINSETGLKTGHIPADRDGDGDIDEDDRKQGQDLQQHLSKLAQEAKDNANKKAGPKPDTPSKLVGVGNSAEGNRKPVAAKEADAEVAAPKGKDKERVPETPAEQALHGILKKGPVVIFSKTYCPHSRRAKGILLEKYLIHPRPEVVELDEHPLGPDLQDLLLGLTGRRTVPNVLINGESIGGADDIVELDNTGKLITKIQALGQRKVEVSERFSTEQRSKSLGPYPGAPLSPTPLRTPHPRHRGTPPPTMRRESTASDATSVVSYETTSSLGKEKPAASADKPRRSSRLREKARRVLADLGAPPTARQDAKDGKRTLNFADPGGLLGDGLLKPGRI